MQSPNITFVVFTYNEAARIERVIENFRPFGKILLADNNSTDGTIEIAKRNGCDVFLRKEEYVFVENQNLVNQLYDVITTEWVYWAFADEMLELKTLKEISKITASGEYDIITMDRKNYFYGNFCYDMFHARTFKIFKKDAIDFTDNVIHKMGKATVNTSRIYDLPDQFFIHHFISNTAESYVNTINKYTTCELLFPHKINTTFFHLLLTSAKMFINEFFRNKGYKTGFSGLVLIQLMMFYSSLKNIKFYEKTNALSNKSIEEKNNVFREQIMIEINKK